MLWFLMYCVWSALFLFVGVKALTLHWFWNAMFGLLAAGTLTYSIHRVARSRLCPARVRRAIKGKKNPKEIRSVVEAAFGTTPDLTDPADAWAAGFFAWLPLTILVFVFLGIVLQSTFWRSVLAFGLGIPPAVAVGTIVNAIASQKQMLESAKQIITEQSPEAWAQMTKAWNDRKKSQATARPAAAQAAAAQRSATACQRCSKPTLRTEDFFLAAKSIGLVVDRSTGQVNRSRGLVSVIGSMLEAEARFDLHSRAQQEVFNSFENQRGFKCRGCGRIYCMECIITHAPAHPNGGKACPKCGNAFAVLD